MEYLTSKQVGRTSDARSRLCDRLEQGQTPAALAAIHTVLNASSFGAGEMLTGKTNADVELSVASTSSGVGAQGVPWKVSMVKVHGRWKGRGFSPQT